MKIYRIKFTQYKDIYPIQNHLVYNSYMVTKYYVCTPVLRYKNIQSLNNWADEYVTLTILLPCEVLILALRYSKWSVQIFGVQQILNQLKQPKKYGLYFPCQSIREMQIIFKRFRYFFRIVFLFTLIFTILRHYSRELP